jgi:hypothetical protein
MAKKLDNESVAKRNDKGETPSTVEGRTFDAKGPEPSHHLDVDNHL